MDFAAILREIDAELEKLTQIREIVAGLAGPVRGPVAVDRTVPARRPRKKTTAAFLDVPALAAEAAEVAVLAAVAEVAGLAEVAEARPPAPEPRLVVLPPVRKREYSRRSRTVVPEPRALAAALSDRPVFVPRAAAPAAVAPAFQPPVMSPEQMMAAIRQNFLGGTA